MVFKKTYSLISGFLNIYWESVVLGVVLVTALILFILYRQSDETSAPLLSGFLTGCVILLLQLCFDLRKSKELLKLKQLRIKRILPYREGKGFYESLVAEANHSIDCAGITMSRFVDDFAHPRRGDSQALLQALERGVNVRFLVPHENYLSEADKVRASKSIERITQIAAETRTGTIEMRVFNHSPAHSIFISDDDCLLGPVFPDVVSKDSPAVHTLKKSSFAKPYIEYFESEWGNANSI